jgi:hypothetical protein
MLRIFVRFSLQLYELLKWTEGHRRLSIYVLPRNKYFVAASAVCLSVEKSIFLISSRCFSVDMS